MDHAALADAAASVADGGQHAAQAEAAADIGVECGGGDEGDAGGGERAAEGAEHGAVVDGLRGGDAGVGVAHGGADDSAALDHQVRLDAEEGGRPEDEVGQFAGFDGADFVGDALRDGRVDGVFGDVAFGAGVVGFAVAGQGAALGLHLVGGLPGADDHLADAAHGLAVAADHADGAEVMQDVLRGDGLAADAAFGEGDVLGDVRVQVVADHEHIEMFVERVGRVGPGGVGGAGQHVGQAGDAQDVRGVAAAGALGMEGVDGAALEGGDGVLDEAGFVEGVRVDHDGDVEAVADGQAAIDGGGGWCPNPRAASWRWRRRGAFPRARPGGRRCPWRRRRG